MKTYKKSDGTVWAFEDDGSQDAFITPDMVLLSDAEVQEFQLSQNDPWKIYQNTATLQLLKNDLVALRCLKAGISYPQEWLANDILLRKIIASPSGNANQDLPLPPTTWPEGT